VTEKVDILPLLSNAKALLATFYKIKQLQSVGT
jgi:hypothetical protein